MSKHTSGPWQPWNTEFNPALIVANVDLGPDGEFRCDTICEVSEEPRDWVANARLIAAAPEMYEALKAFMSFYDKAMEGASPGFDEARGCDHVLFGMNDARLMIGHFWDARDAIAKAEGRT